MPQGDLNRALAELIHWEEQFKFVTGEAWAKRLPVEDEEHAAMISIFNATHGFGWSRAGGWIGRTASARRRGIEPFVLSEATWEGVACEEEKETARNPTPKSRIVGLRLADNNLSGPFPQRVNALKRLATLDLSANNVHGAIGFIGGMEALRYFSANNCNLVGPVPTSVNQLRALLEFNCAGNDLEGDVPWASLAPCRRLLRLDLARNRLTGTLFDATLGVGVGELGNVQHLDLHDNGLSGALPDGMAALVKLRHLDLSENRLTGPLPRWLAGFSSLKKLDLHSNALTGPLPAAAFDALGGSNGALELIYLHRNRLSGTLPRELALLSHLRYVNLSHNELEGPIPDCYCAEGGLTQLQTLLLNNNSIRTPYPAAIGNLSALKDFFGAHGTFSCELGVPRRFRRREFEARYVTGTVKLTFNNFNG